MAPAAACGQDADRGGSGDSPPRKAPRLSSAAAAAAGPPPQEQPSTSTFQAACPPFTSCLSDLVELNVGGVLFTTNRATLEDSQPHSMLAALVSGRHGPPRLDAQVRGEEKEEGHVG